MAKPYPKRATAYRSQLKDIILNLPKSFKGFSIGSGVGDQISLSSDGKKTEIRYIQETADSFALTLRTEGVN